MKSYLPGLNTIRFLIALNVLWRHAQGYLARPLFVPFAVGQNVTAFFVLSGYVITYRLLREQRVTGAIDLRAFYTRRACRLLPLYALVAIVGGLVLPAFGAPAPSPLAFLSILLLVPQCMYVFGLQSGLLIHLWSLGVEEVFYLIYPALIRRWPVVRVCLVIIVLMTGLSGLVYTAHSPLLGLLRVMRIECMAVGALGACAAANRSRWLSIVQSRGVEVGAWIGLLIAAVTSIPMADLVFSGLVIVCLVNVSTNPHSLVYLEGRCSQVMGRLSYGVYLWHLPVLWMASQFASNGALVALAICLTILAAWVTYHLIERPLRDLRGIPPMTIPVTAHSIHANALLD